MESTAQYKCGNGKEHLRNQWCGLSFNLEEQKVISEYLLTIILCAQDPSIMESVCDLLYALRMWSQDWNPSDVKVSRLISPQLRESATNLLQRARACCIPHSEAWCSASECPSCCTDWLKEFGYNAKRRSEDDN